MNTLYPNPTATVSVIMYLILFVGLFGFVLVCLLVRFTNAIDSRSVSSDAHRNSHSNPATPTNDFVVLSRVVADPF